MRDLFIFARAPVLGTVKTRLAATLGDAPALALYRHLLTRTVERLASGRWRSRLCVTPDAAADDAALWPVALPRVRQGEGDLGERMRRRLEPAAPTAPVVVVGSDIPGLDAIHVERAFAALRSAPLVFGPATDGGFYLVGASARPPPGFLAGVRWSSPTTLAETLAGCPASVRPAFVDTLADLDDAPSLVAHVVGGTL